MSRHDLFGVIHDKIPDLLELDEREALKLFLEHPEKLSSDLVSRQLVLLLLLFKSWNNLLCFVVSFP